MTPAHISTEFSNRQYLRSYNFPVQFFHLVVFNS